MPGFSKIKPKLLLYFSVFQSTQKVNKNGQLLRLLQKCFEELSLRLLNPVTNNAPLIQKPGSIFALQINWLVSI